LCVIAQVSGFLTLEATIVGLGWLALQVAA
jgi:hypothetical protein